MLSTYSPALGIVLESSHLMRYAVTTVHGLNACDVQHAHMRQAAIYIAEVCKVLSSFLPTYTTVLFVIVEF